MPTSSQHQTPPRRHGVQRYIYAVGLVASIVMVLVTIVLLPVAFGSLLSSLRHGGTGANYDIWKPSDLSGEWTKIAVTAVSLDEPNREITFDVSGFHNCPIGCVHVQRVQFYSIDSVPSGALGAPPSVSIDLPADSSEVDQSITLPVSGNLTQYPFDKYTILLGVSFSDVLPDGTVQPVQSLTARSKLAFSVDSTIPRVNMAPPEVEPDAAAASPGASYDTIVSLSFTRPAYLWSVTVLVILLIILAEAYGIFLRPFTQLIPTIGGIVLGVWGVRSLLVGSYPPDSTGVDLVLEGLILVLLLAIAVRAAVFMWNQTTGKLVAGGADDPEPGQGEDDPEPPDIPDIAESRA